MSPIPWVLGIAMAAAIGCARAPAAPDPALTTNPLPEMRVKAHSAVSAAAAAPTDATAPADAAAPADASTFDVVKVLGKGLSPYTFHITQPAPDVRVAEEEREETMRVDVTHDGGPPQRIDWDAPTCPKCGAISANEDAIVFVDLDFDGNLDLLLLAAAIKSGSCYEAHLFEPATGRFREPLGTRLCEPVTVPARREIITEVSDITACGSTWWRTTYVWRAGKLTSTKREGGLGPNRCGPLGSAPPP